MMVMMMMMRMMINFDDFMMIGIWELLAAVRKRISRKPLQPPENPDTP